MRKKVATPELSCGLTFQIRLRSSCSSTKAPVATRTKVMMPTIVPRTPEPMLLALAIMVSIALAPVSPTRLPSSATMAP